MSRTNSSTHEESPLEVTLRLCKGFDIDQKHMREARLIYIRSAEEMKDLVERNKVPDTDVSRFSAQAKVMMIATYAENKTAQYIIQNSKGSIYRSRPSERPKNHLVSNDEGEE